MTITAPTAPFTHWGATLMARRKSYKTPMTHWKAFPIVADGDNVIWSDDGNGHFYSLASHQQQNDKSGRIGNSAPLGRKILTHTIADCLCHENRIIQEWLVRDYAGIVIQMGRDIDEAAAKTCRR